MTDDERFQLRFGPYKSPRFRYGTTVACKVRGECDIYELPDALIPWPMGRPHGARGGNSLIVYRGLAKAVRKEAGIVVEHWWGAGHSSVAKWRHELEVPRNNKGTLQLRVEHFSEEWADEARKKAYAKARDPERREKIAAARYGKKRPQSVIDAMRKANTGRKASAATRAKMSRTHKKCGTRPPRIGEPWTDAEDELVRTLPIKEVAAKTGRTEGAVNTRRRALKLPDGRRKENRRQRTNDDK